MNRKGAAGRMPCNLSDAVVCEVIDKGLSALGESPKNALWFCLEKDFDFDRQKVPENLEAFERVLQQFFGLGFSFLDALFRRYLSEYVGEDLSKYSTFAESVATLRKNEKEESEGVALIGESLVTSDTIEYEL